jgi:hypothetical protein
MKTTKKQKIIQSFAGIVIAILLFATSGLKIPVLDTMTDAYFREAITKAGVTYAACRVINASVSIIKESNLQLEPAGVGVSLAIGQALDPIDDMTERLSGVLVTAITSLGVQKLAYDISVSLAPLLFSVFLFTLSLLLWIENDRITFLRKTLLRIVFLIVVARFFLPVSSIADEYLHKYFFADQISNANKELAVGSVELDKFKKYSLPEVDGFLGTLENSALFLKQKTAEFNDALAVIITNAEDIIGNLLKLTYLYVGIFLIQVVLLPLLSFWFLAKIVTILFDTNIPVILNHSMESKNKNVL